jgi:hypothetical protein
LLVACSLPGVAPIPLAGPAPRLVLVLPPSGYAEGETAALLADTLAAALRERGYAVVEEERARKVLAARGVDGRRGPDPAACGAAAGELGADAYLALHVEEWSAQFATGLVRLVFDLGYRLHAAHGGVLWELRSRDAWIGGDGARVPEPATELASYLEPASDRPPPLPYRTPAEAARAVHRAALRYLPAPE